MNITAFNDLFGTARSVVIIQADNPDGDSLASSLMLESILADLGKDVTMYCGVEIPTYLRYMSGWDRIVHSLPNQFDISIIVDTSALSLLESLEKSGELNWLKTKPCIVIDHHETEATIPFATLIINEKAVSTGQIIYKLAMENNWAITVEAMEFCASSILSDSLGLTSEAVNAESVHTLADLVEKGVVLAKIDNLRKTTQRKSAEITKYKGTLLQRISLDPDPRIATIVIPWEEIEKYSHAYNPSMLVIDEMRMTVGVELAIAFKTYPDGRITAKIRANYGYRVANKIAEHFGGGGHSYAAGFKVVDKRPLDEVKSECIRVASELLDTIKPENHETTQHSF